MPRTRFEKRDGWLVGDRIIDALVYRVVLSWDQHGLGSGLRFISWIGLVG